VSSQPNILILMADQLAPHFTGAYGHPIVRTPNMNVLAERGMRFDAAYTNSPLCAPARFSFMAGERPSRIGAWDNAAGFPSFIPTFAHHMGIAGYRTCLSGKMHFVGPDQLHGFHERLTTDVYPADHGWTPDWANADQRLGAWYHNMDSILEAGPCDTSVQLEFDDEASFLAERRLFRFAARQEQPFLMCLSLTHPHDPYEARPEFWDMYPDDQIDMPDQEAPADPHSARIKAGIEAETSGVTEAHIRNARRAYYANVSYVDHQFGRMMRALEKTGQLDNTVIILTCDHGDMLGDRGLWFKMNFYERSARVPLIMAGPGVAAGSNAEPCSLMDLLPTMLDVAGESPSDYHGDGRSLWHLASGGPVDPDARTISEYFGECSADPMVMLRRGAMKYIHCAIDPPQLYDLDKDPEERNNLAHDPAFASLSASFAKEVAATWDIDTLRDEVRQNQRQRHLVHRAMEAGPLVSWDHSPHRDAGNEYVRSHITWMDAAKASRWPPVQEN
jgi:choline-sulfatase